VNAQRVAVGWSDWLGAFVFIRSPKIDSETNVSKMEQVRTFRL